MSALLTYHNGLAMTATIRELLTTGSPREVLSNLGEGFTPAVEGFFRRVHPNSIPEGTDLATSEGLQSGIRRLNGLNPQRRLADQTALSITELPDKAAVSVYAPKGVNHNSGFHLYVAAEQGGGNVPGRYISYEETLMREPYDPKLPETTSSYMAYIPDLSATTKPVTIFGHTSTGRWDGQTYSKGLYRQVGQGSIEEVDPNLPFKELVSPFVLPK